jgi:hypothetical protein
MKQSTATAIAGKLLEAQFRKRYEVIMGKPLDLKDLAACEAYAAWGEPIRKALFEGNIPKWLDSSTQRLFRKIRR